MGAMDRLRAIRTDIARAAAARYAERQGPRDQAMHLVAEAGPGAADSPQRQQRLATRQAAFATARAMRAQGTLPIALERKIGATLDFQPFAPSGAAAVAGKPVARIVELGGPGTLPEGFGTGFLVSPRLLLTNHHVFPTPGDAQGCAANFLFERRDRAIAAGVLFEFRPEECFLTHEALDFTVVAVAPRAADGTTLDSLGIIALVEATPKILIGQRVNIIQHPEGGPKQYAVQNNRVLDILDTGFLHYETDTLEGSSGSPVFSESWELVALHHAGIPAMRGNQVLARDGKPWRAEMGDAAVQWVANEGTRVSAIVRALGAMQPTEANARAMRDELLASTSDPADEVMQAGAATPSALPPQLAEAFRESGMTDARIVFTGPVTINVTLAAPAAPAVAAPVAAPAAEEASLRFDRNYAKRAGYEPGFLGGGLVVPRPDVAAGRAGEMLPGRDGKPQILKYHHFELAMNESRRLQMWSAVNVDYDPAKKTKRPGGRDGFGRDRWIPDPRIPAAAQIMDAEFYKPAGNIDRGHIVRREDNAWGDTEEEIEFANSDTFHWTNCTPQHEAFNQSDPGRNDPTYAGLKGLWGDFENHIQQQLKAPDTRACILAGPVLAKDDPSADFGAGPVQYPLLFWKVVAVPMTERGKRVLRCFGFMLSQKAVVEQFGIERFDPGRFKGYQVALREIERLAGVVFEASLHRADPLAKARAPRRITKLAQVAGIPGVTPEESAEEPIAA
jgi:endonuclease G, mitochondrial